MKTYRTKLQAYEAGYMKGSNDGFALGKDAGIAQEKARIAKATKKKLDPLYNRPLALKERVDREAEQSVFMTIDEIYGIGLGKTKQPSLWEKIINALDIRKILP